ncbi:MAG: ATP-dependent helicase HrpB [Hyphomonadaceae bacterium]
MTPVDAILPQLVAALEQRSEAVLVAPPGAGKTTRVPPGLLAHASWMRHGKLIVLAPRRIAARAAAARMAAERNERVGETIGYRVRLDSRLSEKTRIEVVTEGVFTRLVLDDPELRGVAGVIFDEFHERSLEGDLGLALARDVQAGLRSDLRLLVMSATLDASRIAKLLGDAPVIVSEGRMHPVAVRYRPRNARDPIEDAVTAAIREALLSEAGGALVFLPGAREIERSAEKLRSAISDPNIDVRPLYGAMGPREQDDAIAPAPQGRRKVVLATSIAETSLTIEGVRVVIDAGLARRPRFEPSLGLSRLETVRASQAAIAQRAGRAGRLEPGVCVRLWSEGETRALPEFDRPEILDADLSGLALDLAAWGVSDPGALTWLDPPPPVAWREAGGLLQKLGAIDADFRLTPHGRRLARLPLPPRLAHMLVRAGETGDALLAARAAVLLTEQGLGGRSSDLRHRLHRFHAEGGQRAEAARRLADRLARQAGGAAGACNEERAGAVLALAYPDRVAKRRGAAFLMVNGRAAAIDAGEAMAREDMLVIADVSGAAGRAQILLAAPIAAAEAERLFADAIETKTAVTVDDQSGAVRGRRLRKLGAIVLSETPLDGIGTDELEAALLEAVRDGGMDVLVWSEDARQVRARVAVLRRLEPDVWPDWSEEGLMETLEAWLGPALMGRSRLRDVDPGAALLQTLDHPLQQRLAREAPARFTTPAGSALRIDYGAEGGPALDVRLQEMFGLDTHPSVAGGRVPLTVRLLSSAHRPVQTTKDLPGFWRGSYAAVRADMRGRYPKHPWPEDPIAAAPTRRAKPKGG